jgi:tetratricopeptide (TPR) repeat protein
LEESIGVCREALDLLPESHPNRSSSLSNLASVLLTRFQQTCQLADLEESIGVCREALNLPPGSHPNRSSSLSNLASALLTRFQQTGQLTDLEESIDVCREALDLLPESHPNRSSSLSNLAKALSTRFQQTGQLADLEESIGLHRKALELFSGSHPDQSASLNNLAKPLSTRFQQTGLRADLEESIGFLTTPIARDNNVFWLTRGNDGRYTVATWAIHGIQIGMLFRVNSPPAILRVTEILKSSSILEAYDASADIPSGVAAFAMMDLGMKVYLEPPFALPPDFSMIDSCFAIVPERHHADLILSLEPSDSGDKLRIESMDPLLRHLSCHVTHMDWNEVRDHLPRSLDAIAHFRYHLGRRSDPGDPFTASEMSTHVADHIFSDSEICLFVLDPATLLGFREPEQPERNLLSPTNRTATLRYEKDIKYGMRLRSKPLQSHLFFYVFYMDPSDFSIQVWVIFLLYSSISVSFIRRGTCLNHLPIQPAKLSV